MKKNLPITDNEIPFPDGEEIISTTDLKGVLTSFNDTFLRISGFEANEMLGHSHNVVRHPEMPPAAFADLWASMKANRHWMGIVKNRCKNGDYYWVDAYVTPITENGRVTGYESVRAKPTAEQVARAEIVYKQINAGKKPVLGNFLTRLTIKNRSVLLNIFALLVAGITFNFTPADISFLPTVIGLLAGSAVFFIGTRWSFSPLNAALETAQKQVNNPLMALIYTGRADEIGQIQLPEALHTAKLRTILGRIKEAASKIKDQSDSSAAALSQICSSIQQQTSETDMVATAMNEMTSTVHEVAKNAAYAAQKSEDTNHHSQEGVRHASGAVHGLQGLNQAVHNVANVVSKLDQNTQNIGTVIDVIKGIAEQTNLLALNAAIEAARAGEQGRGFAVVADEVRTLAGRTQDSTQEIQKLIEDLNSSVAQAVSVMASSGEAAKASEEEVTKAIESLNLIAEQVGGMSDLNAQIATAVEEQSSVSEEINRNVVRISSGSENVLMGAQVANKAASNLSEQSLNLANMIARFRA